MILRSIEFWIFALGFTYGFLLAVRDMCEDMGCREIADD